MSVMGFMVRGFNWVGVTELNRDLQAHVSCRPFVERTPLIERTNTTTPKRCQQTILLFSKVLPLQRPAVAVLPSLPVF